MAITLELTPEIELRLKQEALRQGATAEEYAIQLLDEHLPSGDRRAKAVSLIQSWLDADDAGEQKETGEYLARVLDEDRLSDRKLFPPELKGVTW